MVSPITPFVVGRTYTRNDIYELMVVPPERQRGDWLNGYHREGDDWFIFANVGVAGRTGHDYDNHWRDDGLFHWRGKTTSSLHQPSIQSMLKPKGRIFLFTRNEDRHPFTFDGSVKAKSWKDTVPVTIVWELVDEAPTVVPLAEEVAEPTTYYEGATKTISVNAYERNPEARRKCIEHYGYDCFVCGFNFEKVYGEIGKGYIHVHHLKPLSEIKEGYLVDPIKDLRPVCPNCHALLHVAKGDGLLRNTFAGRAAIYD